MLRRYAPVLLCLLAFTLSVLLLDSRSLWGDEAFSVWASKQPALALIAGLDAQPPLYHLALKWSRAVWGESVFAIRFLSVVCGVLTSAIAVLVGRIVAGERGAWLCGLLLATSPMMIYFNQEARMYSIAAMMSAGAIWFMLMLMQRPSLARWICLVLFSLGALSSHFYTVTILAVNALALLTTHRRRLIAWLVSHATIALVFGVWFFGAQWRVLTKSASSRTSVLPPLDEIVHNIQRGANGLVFGMRAENWLAPVALAFVVLAILGAFAFWKSGKRDVALAGLGWSFLSYLFVFATASPSGIVPDFNPRYLLFTLLPLAVLASGYAHAAQRSAIVSIILIFFSSSYGNAQLIDTSWNKSRYDEMMQTIRANAKTNDGVALLNSDQFPLHNYYGANSPPTWIMSNALWGKDSAITREQFDTFAKDKTRVWLVKYGWVTNPSVRSEVERRLEETSARIYKQDFQDVTLSLYQKRDAFGGWTVEKKNFRLGEAIRLIGVRASENIFKPGDVISFDLIWRAENQPPSDFTVFVHLRHADNSGQIAAFDGQPSPPTSNWRQGLIITDTRGIEIPQSATPGAYRIFVGMYQYPSFERLRIDDSNETELVALEVQVEN
jgi:hypothetical protein